MRRIVTFGNCQADALSRVLSVALPESEYSPEFYSNNDRTGGMKAVEEILAAVRNADILVFQPLDDKHGVLREESIRSKANGAVVAFPYIFNSGVAGLVHTGANAAHRRSTSRAKHSYGNVFGEKPIINRLERGVPIEKIVDDYVNGSINFNVRQRFNRCMEELRRREQATEIRIADHIADNYRSKRQFLTHNHPTTDLLTEICRQLKDLTGLPIDIAALETTDEDNLAGLPGDRRKCVISPHDAEELGYEFGHDSDWLARGTAMVKIVGEGYREEHEAAHAAPA